MLQDLDARRSDATGGNSFGQQIRAVPERRRVHPAWWVALALGGMLIGVVAFVLLRPVPAAPQGAAAKLPLKLDIDLSAPLSVQQSGQITAPAAIPETANPVAPHAEPSVSVPPAPVEPVAVSKPVQVSTPEAVVTEKKPVVPKATISNAPAKERSVPAPVPPVTEVVPPAKSLAAVPVAKNTDVSAPLAINKQIKELTPAQRAENEYRKAVLALQQGRRAEAIGGLEQTLQIDPRHSGARHALIGVLLDGKQQDEAIAKAREGLSADPAQSGLAMILARLQLEKGELRPAIETLERTLPHASEKADYLAFLAALLQRDERHKQAVEHYLLALQKAPQNGIWWMGLGISLQAEKRIPEAQESFKRAKATNSLSPELLAFVEARLSQLQQ
jgi:MSHA biogenesis protein MshN